MLIPCQIVGMVKFPRQTSTNKQMVFEFYLFEQVSPFM